jgi:hypothetical protein
MKVEVNKRTAVFAELQNYCHMSGKDDYIELTKWTNGEGFDIQIDSKRGAEQYFSLTYGEWQLLQVLMNWEGE